MNIPAILQSGDTWSWTDSLSDYPATTYTLKYALYRYGQAVITITATASGADYAIDVTAANTKGKAAGEWNWSAYVESTGIRYTVDTGKVTIKADLAAAGSTADLRSYAQKMLDAIEAVMLGRASHAELSLTINGKSIQYLKPSELEGWRNVYRREVNKENNVNSSVLIQFGSA